MVNDLAELRRMLGEAGRNPHGWSALRAETINDIHVAVEFLSDRLEEATSLIFSLAFVLKNDLPIECSDASPELKRLIGMCENFMKGDV